MGGREGEWMGGRVDGWEGGKAVLRLLTAIKN